MFHKFLDEVLPAKDVQEVLQEFVGCCLNPFIKLEKALCCVGSGFNGKSVFFEIVMALLGEDNVCSYNINSLCDDKGLCKIGFQL
jgi:putative DNA primase/helicase